MGRGGQTCSLQKFVMSVMPLSVEPSQRIKTFLSLLSSALKVLKSTELAVSMAASGELYSIDTVMAPVGFLSALKSLDDVPVDSLAS